MATIINEGYLELTDGTDTLLLYFKQCKWDYIRNPKNKHFAGGSHLGYDLGKKWLEWTFIDIYGTSHSNMANIILYLNNWQTNDHHFTLKIKRDGSNYIACDGTNTSFTVNMPNGMKQMEKIAPGTQDGPYVIKMLKLEQCG